MSYRMDKSTRNKWSWERKGRFTLGTRYFCDYLKQRKIEAIPNKAKVAENSYEMNHSYWKLDRKPKEISTSVN